MPNKTHNYLLATEPISTLCFSGLVGSTSVYLNGPGNQAGNGFPMLRKGYLTGLAVWDGTTVRSDRTQVSFVADDKISLYCQNVGSNFTVRVRINGSSTTLQVASVPFGTTLYATVEFMLLNR